ncbi:hypothetical protein LIER_39757 [Lithospermum erythrorhizon]|uniref:DUF4283 domain-containing protein n=1 Tax=Lithospermum erythrorhizon TaxID=34254 RepID=A0AAV3QM95_LITER
MKLKKRKVPKDDHLVDDSLMVPSVADPNLMVRVPIDHRVCVHGVLEAGLMSKVNEWSASPLGATGSISTVNKEAVGVVFTHAKNDDDVAGGDAGVGDGVSVAGGDAVAGVGSVVVFKAGSSGGSVAGKSVARAVGGRKGAKNAKRLAGVEGPPGAGVTFGTFTGLAGKAAQQRAPVKVGFDICGSETDEDDTPPLPTHACAKPGPPLSAHAHAKTGHQPKPTFAGFFKENRLEGNGFKLQFHDFKDDDVVLDESDEVPFVETWGFFLIGCFTGPFPAKPALDSIVKGWGVKCRVLPYGKGWTVFRFQIEHMVVRTWLLVKH